ncbi:MAG TPA: LuxR C-terminal-related transcriptional regulator [Chitinophagaceae bacterium]|nr:LuxR C-terminal-related transcriptional regulator [Chitinophagaceae bacterium]
MEKIIYIFHRNTSLAETLAWTLQLGTDLKAVCLQDPQQLKTVVGQADLVLTEPAFFESISENSVGFSFPVLLIASNPEFDKIIEALYAGADDVVDPGNGPEEIIEKTNQLLHHKTDEKNLLIKKLIQQIKAPGKGERDGTDYGLTVKEKEILHLMKEAQHLKQIAQVTNSSYETVRTHVKHIYKKLGVMSASEAVIRAMKMDL